jgi:CubicO group peptidase (beta-lactamase class C family)
MTGIIAARPAVAPVADRLDEIQSELDEMRAAHGIPGLQLGVADGTRRWTFTSGVNDLKRGQPVTDRTLFSFASLSKFFTTTLAMRLVDAGRLDLDAPPSEYLPGLRLPPPYGDGVTIGQLLSHTSGLGGPLEPDEEETAEHAVYRLAAELVWHAPPGTQYASSNGGYVIAAACLDRILGQSWSASLRELVLEPAGARHATTDRGTVRAADVVRGHVPSRTGELLVLPVPWAQPAMDATASVFGTVDDVLAVAQDHLTAGPGRLLSAAAVAEMRRPRVAIPDCFWSCATLAWLAGVWGRPMLDARGDHAGQETILRVVPETGRAMVLASNGWTHQWPYFGVLPELSRTVLGVEMPPDPAPLPVRDPGRYTGDYDRPTMRFTVLEGAGGGLILRSRNRTPRGGLFIELDDVELVRAGPDVFLFDMPNVDRRVSVGFSGTGAGGEATRIHLFQRVAERRPA